MKNQKVNLKQILKIKHVFYKIKVKLQLNLIKPCKMLKDKVNNLKT